MIDKIKQIKKSRMKPEEIWFLDIINDLEEVKSDKYPNSTFWKKDGVILFEYDIIDNALWISFKEIWTVFENTYGYKYQNFDSFINKTMGGYLNRIGFIKGKVLILLSGDWVNFNK